MQVTLDAAETLALTIIFVFCPPTDPQMQIIELPFHFIACLLGIYSAVATNDLKVTHHACHWIELRNYAWKKNG